MKIAVACLGDQVSEHFGHCEGFAIYETIDDVIIAKGMTPNPGHKPGFLPNFLADMGVELIIAGGMGGGAVEIFNERNIRVITGERRLPGRGQRVLRGSPSILRGCLP